MIPEFPDFIPIDLKILNYLKTNLQLFPKAGSEFSCVNIFIWRYLEKPRISQLFGNLLIQVNFNNYLLEPIGNERVLETVDHCLAKNFQFFISENLVSNFQNNAKYYLKTLPDFFDYIYKVSDFAEFAGRKYHNIKNHINKFQRYFPNFKYENLAKQHKEQALEMLLAWSKSKNDVHTVGYYNLETQISALNEAFDNFEELELSGGIIYLNDEAKGLILGSKLNSEMANVHFLYAKPGFDGINQVLLNQACKNNFKSFSLLNLEQDLGLPGLKKSKMAYLPEKILQKFELKLSK